MAKAAAIGGIVIKVPLPREVTPSMRMMGFALVMAGLIFQQTAETVGDSFKESSKTIGSSLERSSENVGNGLSNIGNGLSNIGVGIGVGIGALGVCLYFASRGDDIN